MAAIHRVTLEDLLACWRATVALGARSDPEIATDVSRAIATEAAFAKRTPQATLAGDNSVASAAQRVRPRVRPDAPRASLSNSADLRALGFVAVALAGLMTQPGSPGSHQQVSPT